MKPEDPPNKQAYAEDLADKLAKLSLKINLMNGIEGDAAYSGEQIQEINVAKPTITIQGAVSSEEPKSGVVVKSR